jgi:guanylate kinase
MLLPLSVFKQCRVSLSGTSFLQPCAALYTNAVDAAADMEVISPELAQQMVQDGKFLVHQTVMGHTYGITAAAVRKLQASGKLPVLDLDRVADVTRLKESGFQVRYVFKPHLGWCALLPFSRTCGSMPDMCSKSTLCRLTRVPAHSMHTLPHNTHSTAANVTVRHTCCGIMFSQGTYVYLQPPSLEQLRERVSADVLANPPLQHEPAEAAEAAAAEATAEASAAAAQRELFDEMLVHDPQVTHLGNQQKYPFMPSHHTVLDLA